MTKRDFILPFIGLLIVLIGAIVVCCMGFPAGLLIIIPSGIPHICRIYYLMKDNCAS